MLQEARFCPNCNTALTPYFIRYDGKDAGVGIYVCRSCNILDVSKQTMDDLYRVAFMKELGYDDVRGQDPQRETK